MRRGVFLAVAAACLTAPVLSPAGMLSESEQLTVRSGEALYSADNIFNGRNTDIRLVKYDTRSGGVYWSQNYDSGRHERVRVITLDSADNLILAGSMSSTDEDSQFLIVSYNKYGSLSWVQTYGVGPDATIILAETDDKDNVYVSGVFNDGRTFSLWTAKYSSRGNRIWGRIHSSGYNDYPRNLYVAPLGDVVLTFERAQPSGGGQLFLTETILYNSHGQRR